MTKWVGQGALFGVALFFGCAAAAAGDNPMWKNGYSWACHAAALVTCERSKTCATETSEFDISIRFEKNEVVARNTYLKISRHYTVSVPGSPLATEVKVEFGDNETLWLVPADASGVFSNNWIGSLVTPRGGVIVSELRPLVCVPETAR